MQATSSPQRWFQTGGGEVLKSVAAFALMLALAIFIYAAYHRYALRGRNEGDVTGEPQESVTAARRAAPGNHQAVAADAGGPNSAAGQTAAVTLGSAGAVAPGNARAETSLSGVNAGPAAPATDTIAPNPPNGLAFGGSGHFQVYRQGDITWRLNTETGATCVVFATDAEWRQPRIRRAACQDARQ